jgi:hypothetical protein
LNPFLGFLSDEANSQAVNAAIGVIASLISPIKSDFGM